MEVSFHLVQCVVWHCLLVDSVEPRGASPISQHGQQVARGTRDSCSVLQVLG